MTTNTDRTRKLNDEFRQNLSAGTAVITAGVAALGQQFVNRIVQTIAVFDDFQNANDPHAEHDFGAFEIDGHALLFKIDYFDQSMTWHSTNPADPTVTQRVITVMLAQEY